jgi:hypothetical protein
MVFGLMSNRTEAHREADSRYTDKRYVKRVSFNTETEKALIAKVDEIENFSEWVKKQLASM